MLAEQKEIVDKLKKDFSNLKKKKKLSSLHEDKLITDITGLIGIYNTVYDEKLAELIEKMISFGEKQLWAMQGSMYLFDKITKKWKKKGLIK